jgi:hypothetical protein
VQEVEDSCTSKLVKVKGVELLVTVVESSEAGRNKSKKAENRDMMNSNLNG